MAEEIIDNSESIVSLTKLTLRKALLEQERKLIAADSDKAKRIQESLKNIELEIAKKKSLLQVGEQSLRSIEKETAKKKELQKVYEEQVKAIQASGKSIKEQNKAIRELQQNMSKQSKRDIRDTTSTFGTVFKALKGFDFKNVATTWTSAKGVIGLAKNSIAALGGAAAVGATGLGLLATGAKMFYDNFIVPSARMRNIAGQQLGLAAGSRNLWGGHWMYEWADRTLLGYSAEEQQGLYSAMVDALRLDPRENTNTYQNVLKGMMANQRLFGTSTGSMNKIYKAFDQTGTSSTQLSEKFYTLMRGVEGTGWTTSEYADTLAKNVMYLKNFGVNIDTYSKELLKYGEAIRTEKLTTEEISPHMRNEGPGEMAFVAQQMLKSGILTEKQLGAGLGDSLFKQSGALRVLSTKDPIRYKQLLYKLYTSDPQYRALLANAGVLGDNVATWELMTRINAPGMGALSEIANKGPGTFRDIVTGNLGSRQSTGLGDTQTQEKIVSDAMSNVAQMTKGFKMLLIEIASMIKNFSATLPDDNPQGFNTGGQ